MTLSGLEFVDPAVCSCLQWEAWCRPQARELLTLFSSGHLPFTSPQPHAARAPQAAGSCMLPEVAPVHSTQAQPVRPVHGLQRRGGEGCSESSGGDSQARSLPKRSPSGCEISHVTGNPLYGRCEVEGCQSYKLRKHIMCCWKHLEVLLPNELRVVQALQSAELLRHLFPCDLVSAVLLSGQCAKLGKGFLPFAIVAFLKIPSASAAFVDSMVAAGNLQPKTYVQALESASTS